MSTRRDDTELRAKVAAELTELTADGGIAGRDSDRATTHIFPTGTPQRLRLHQMIVTQMHSDASDVIPDAAAAIITAGVPGAGKSTAMATLLGDERAAYRDLDADDIKDALLADALRTGLYAELLTQRLADGKPVTPRELAVLVHDESVRLCDLIRREHLARGERLIIHGTLTWPQLGPQLADEIWDAGYEALRIIAVDVPVEVAHERALSRWWGPRCEGTEPLGGRFTPPGVITAAYTPGNPQSVCVDNAIALRDYVTLTYPRLPVTLEIIDADGTRQSS